MGIAEALEPGDVPAGSVGELLDGRASDDLALIAPGGVSLTYARLAARAGTIRDELTDLGVRRDDRVALVLPNGLELAVAFLAVSAGAACAPLNPAYRARELDFYLSDVRAKALLIDAGTDSLAREVAARRGIAVVEVAPLDGDEAGAHARWGGSFDGGLGASRAGDVALVLHTSGTTARPKIVPLTHANLCASARHVAQVLRLDEHDRCLNVMPLFHIHGLVGALLSSLWAGGSVICAPGFHAPSFFSWLDELEPTWYTAVPTMHQAVLARAPANREVIERCGLRLIRSSSAALPPRVLDELEGTFGVPVIESYGMTEAAHQMASNPLPPGERKPGSVGVASGPRIAILDESGTPLPSGAVGEVAVAGENVFSGYEANPEANETAFSNGWLRTGDEGLLDADGYLYLRGRLKEIINRAGEKISPREVDEVVLGHPAVAQAATFAVPDERLGEDVAVAVVLREGMVASEREIQDFTAARIADFKVPRRVLVVDEIPKGPTGKVQRLGLAERLGVVGAIEQAPGPHVEPRSERERELAGHFAEALRVDRVGVDDDFFALGGDSVTGAELIARLRDAYARPALPLVALLRAPTVSRMAQELEQPEPASGGSPVVPIQTEGALPPLWFVHGLDGEVLRYAPLARRLGDDQPFYGLRARGVDSNDPETGRVEDMAADYLAELRAIQPHGPYYLGALCMGGPIALEMGRRIHAAGEEVALLALVDPRVGIRKGLAYYLRRLVAHARRNEVPVALWRLAMRWLGQTRRDPLDPLYTPEERAFQESLGRARDAYRPAPVDADAVILVSRDYAISRRYWRRLIRGRVGWRLVGDRHRYLFLPPAVDCLAEALGSELRDARERQGGAT